MLSDVINYDLFKSRTNKAGNIFALNTLLVKASMAIGAGGAFAVLDAFHYHAGKANTGSGETGLLICYILIPSALHLRSAAAGWGLSAGRESPGDRAAAAGKRRRPGRMTTAGP